MQVKDLADLVEKNSPKYTHASLSNLEFTPGSLKVKGTDLEFTLGDKGLKKFSMFLGIPKAFLPKLSTGLQSDVVNYFLDRNGTDDALISYSADNSFNTAYPGNTALIRDEVIVSAIEKAFDAEDRVRSLDLTNGIKASIVTNEITTEPRVNDITEGGLRIASTIGEAPTIATYLERLVCSNGMVVPSVNSILSLRGRTVDEIIAEMEYLASTILNSDVPDALDRWSHMSEIVVTNAERLIHRFCQEYNLGSRIEAKILDRIGELEGNTYYDIINLITSMQHELGVSDAMRQRLQLAGGLITVSDTTHRCNSCQHPLD